MKMLGISEPLRALVERKFIQARDNSDILFSSTELSTLRSTLDSAIQLRYCPALKAKPTTDSTHKDDATSPKIRFDPFEDPSPGLLIARVPSGKFTHNLVLNKYPVIENHFILATKGNKQQSGLLEEDDLYLTYSCLSSWEIQDGEGNNSLFAFFNSGEHSGASQPHRHLQLLPVENMTRSVDDGWQLLCNSMTTKCHESLPLLHNSRLPFVHYATRLDAGMNARDIHDRYILLLKAAQSSINGDSDLNDIDAVSIEHNGETTFSYNLAMTPQVMAILPRRQDAAVLANSSDGYVFVNGTILAGTLMVRSEDDWERLRQNPNLVLSILDGITFPRPRPVKDTKQNL